LPAFRRLTFALSRGAHVLIRADGSSAVLGSVAKRPTQGISEWLSARLALRRARAGFSTAVIAERFIWYIARFTRLYLAG